MTRKEKIAGIEEFLKDSYAEIERSVGSYGVDSTRISWLRENVRTAQRQIAELKAQIPLTQAQKNRLMRDMGLVRVVGDLGGIYWE